MKSTNTQIDIYGHVAKNYLWILKSKQKELLPINCDAKAANQLIRNIGNCLVPGFVIDGNNREAYNQMFYYFTRSSQFEGDLGKGLLCVGEPGSGKTLAFEIFRHWLVVITKGMSFKKNNSPFLLINKTFNIKTEFSDKDCGGYKALEKYTDPLKIWVFDDLGEEIEGGKEATHYLDKCNIMKYLLTIRADHIKEFRTITHATSNYKIVSAKNAKFYHDHYGKRVHTRMNEIFNVIHFKGGSRRK